MASATIKLFLVHGDPKRLRTAELSNWTGKAVSGPRTEFEGVLAREESEKSGIYFLTGTDPETGKPAIYIGEAECVRDLMLPPYLRTRPLTPARPARVETSEANAS